MIEEISPTSKRITQIDFLRAVAVIGVLLYHLNLRWFRGGFLGVDLFFVISGYVITRNLIDSITLNSELDLKKFYWSRIRRIYPALLAVIISSGFLIYFFANDAASRFLNDLPYVLLGLYNWHLVFLHQDYFAANGRPPILQQTWTLGVELQFYLIWPLILNFIWKKFGKKRISLFSLLIALFSGMALLLVSVLADNNSKISHIYFGTDTHSIGLFLGAALAVNWIPRNLISDLVKSARIFFTGIGIFSLSGILLLFIWVNPNNNQVYELAIPLMSILGALAIFSLIHPGSVLQKYLANPVALWIGERSYGIYLWHWLVFEITRPNIDLTGPSFAINIFRILLTFTLADLSYRNLELPIRKHLFQNWWRGLRYRPAKIRKSGRSITIASLVIAPVLSLTLIFIAQAEYQNSKVVSITSDSYSTLPKISTETPGIWLTGDSIILGVTNYLAKFYHLKVINARVGRQIGDLIDAVRNDATLGKGDYIVMDVGNNNILTKSDLVDLLNLTKSAPKVVLVNTAVPRAYRASNDSIIEAVASQYPNLKLVDWYQISLGHPEYFAPDGVHLVDAGDQAYVGAIMEALRR